MTHERTEPLRADAQLNRERILDVGVRGVPDVRRHITEFRSRSRRASASAPCTATSRPAKRSCSRSTGTRCSSSSTRHRSCWSSSHRWPRSASRIERLAAVRHDEGRTRDVLNSVASKESLAAEAYQPVIDALSLLLTRERGRGHHPRRPRPGRRAADDGLPLADRPQHRLAVAFEPHARSPGRRSSRRRARTGRESASTLKPRTDGTGQAADRCPVERHFTVKIARPRTMSNHRRARHCARGAVRTGTRSSAPQRRCR